MSDCILCIKTAKVRKYFFKNKPLCDEDYIGYLEFLIKDSDEDVTTESVNSAFESYKISLDSKPVPIKIEIEKESSTSAPSPYSSPFSMGM